jgi:hypothetical protein
MPPFQLVRQMTALLELPWSNVSALIVKWKCLGTTMAQPRSGRPHKLTELENRMLKRVVYINHLSSAATLTTELQTAPGLNVSTITISWELLEMGFRG